MRVRIETRIRGQPIQILWDEGTVTGDLELVDRARRMCRSRRQPIDETDITLFLSALELAAGDHLDITIWPESNQPEHA